MGFKIVKAKDKRLAEFIFKDENKFEAIQTGNATTVSDATNHHIVQMGPLTVD